MPNRKRHIYFWIINALLALLLFAVQYNRVFSIKIGTANAMLPLALVVTVSMFQSELNSSIFGLISGIVTDGAAATPVCFNAILFMLLALTVSIASKHLFNINIRSAAVLGLLSSLIYFFVRWIVVLFYGSISAEMIYIMRYIFPSAIYTAVFSALIYFLQKKLYDVFYTR